MMMDDSDLDKKFNEADKLLDDNKLDEAISLIEYIEVRQKVIQHKTRKKRANISILIILISIILVSLGMTLTIPATEINMVLTSNGMRVDYMPGLDDYSLSGKITGQHPAIDNIVYFNSAPLSTYKNFPMLAGNPVAGDLSIEADFSEITDLSLNVKDLAPRLIFDKRQNNFSLYIINASFSGKLTPKGLSAIDIQDDNSQITRKSYDAKKSQPAYYFQTGGSTLQPVPDVITVSQKYGVDLTMNNIHSISFSRENQTRPGDIEPTIMNGKIHLVDLGSDVLIDKDEYLTLECKNCSQTTVNYSDDYLSITIKGKVKKLSAGYRDSISNLMPTILEYLYHNQKMAMIWAAIIFCWGFIWNLRRWVI